MGTAMPYPFSNTRGKYIMRRMTKTLSDGNPYTFQTLSRLHINNYQSIFNSPSARKMQAYQTRLDTDGMLEEEEYEEFLQLQNERMQQVNDLIRISMSAQHPEFRLNQDPNTNKQLNDKLEELVDLRDTAQIMEFITTGTVTQVKETFVKEEDIVL